MASGLAVPFAADVGKALIHGLVGLAFQLPIREKQYIALYTALSKDVKNLILDFQSGSSFLMI
jgi:hypothetical protein